MKDVGSGIEALDGVDNQIEVVELSSDRSLEVRKEAVSGYSAGRAVEHGGKLRQADRRARKLAAGNAAQDDLLDRGAGHFRAGLWLERNEGSRGRRTIAHFFELRRK